MVIVQKLLSFIKRHQKAIAIEDIEYEARGSLPLDKRVRALELATGRIERKLHRWLASQGEETEPLIFSEKIPTDKLTKANEALPEVYSVGQAVVTPPAPQQTSDIPAGWPTLNLGV